VWLLALGIGNGAVVRGTQGGRCTKAAPGVGALGCSRLDDGSRHGAKDDSVGVAVGSGSDDSGAVASGEI
jgi:hypothetical protein